MKALIPAAGTGTRLRPHTHNKPKALLPVAGKPILGHIIDDLLQAGVDEVVLIIGYCGEAVRAWAAGAYPGLPVTCVEQSERLGLGHAVWTARDAIGDEPFFCILGDTIVKTDYRRLLADPHNCIAVREVADPRRFGVVEMRDGEVLRFVEKPEVPPSNLAIVGAYLLRDAPSLWAAMDRIVAEDRRTRGEYQLTDGLQAMLAGGCRFSVQTVGEWYDCGKRETWLETNRALLDADPAATGASSGVAPPCLIAPGARVVRSRLGPHVVVGAGALIEDCDLTDTIVGDGAEVRRCRLTGSLIGERALVTDVDGSVNVGDDSEVAADRRVP
ncbi:MAG: sugar phosphate nucleotidyltransferase [bacterium]|nr:sugar phosphate nucleotidyltransferase [bacterium]